MVIFKDVTAHLDVLLHAGEVKANGLFVKVSVIRSIASDSWPSLHDLPVLDDFHACPFDNRNVITPSGVGQVNGFRALVVRRQEARSNTETTGTGDRLCHSDL
jgi:hypothetical protein